MQTNLGEDAAEEDGEHLLSFLLGYSAVEHLFSAGFMLQQPTTVSLQHLTQ